MSRSSEEAPAPAPAGGGASLADRLREHTRAVHAEAERSGIVAELLAGRGGRDGWALLLRNLHPAYACLEAELERRRDHPALAPIAVRAVYRAAAIEADLVALAGPAWGDLLPLLPAGERYARRVQEAADRDGARLLAHAYTRFLGDLNGGRVLARLLSRAFDLGPEVRHFFAYPEAGDLAAARDAYRRAIDAAGARIDAEAAADEALTAFRLNIEVSDAVARAVRGAPAAGRA